MLWARSGQSMRSKFKLSSWVTYYSWINFVLFFLGDWLVNFMANHFQQLFESLFILHSDLLIRGQFKIDFSKVHTDCLFTKLFEESVHKIDGESIFFCSSCWFEFTAVDTVNVKGHPVLILLALKVMIDLLWNTGNILRNTLLRFKN